MATVRTWSKRIVIGAEPAIDVLIVGVLVHALIQLSLIEEFGGKGFGPATSDAHDE